MLQFIPVAMGPVGEGMPGMWASPGSCMGQQQQVMQMMMVPMQAAPWANPVQLPVQGIEYRDACHAATSMKTAPQKHSAPGYQKRCSVAPEPESTSQLRLSVEGAMLPEELTVMRRALAEMQQVRAAQPLSSTSMDSLPSYHGTTMESLPSYQGTTMDSLPSMDAADLDSVAASGGMGQTQAAALMKALAGSDERTRSQAIEQITESMWPMAVQRHGCRVAQKAFEVADQDQKDLLAEGLRGHMKEAIESPHGNHVVQKCIESNSTEGMQIVLDEMRGAFPSFARRRFGCRVIERLLEYCTGPQISEIGQEIMLEADELITHSFGNFVIQHVLMHGATVDRHQIVKLLVKDIYSLSRHRVASHVIEAALAHSCPDDKRLLVQALSANPAELALLGQSHAGSFVAREMTRVQADMALKDDVPRCTDMAPENDRLRWADIELEDDVPRWF